MMKKSLFSSLVLALAVVATPVAAEDYVIDTKGAHASVQFKIKHLGYSWLYGRFNTFVGEFSYDEKQPNSAKISVTIDTASLDSNHAERDKHLRGSDFFDVKKYPRAKFVSTSYKEMGEKGELKGILTLRGVTKPVTIAVNQIGAGDDPWGGFRRGFAGSTTITLADFGFTYNLGPASREAEIMLSIEGIRK